MLSEGGKFFGERYDILLKRCNAFKGRQYNNGLKEFGVACKWTMLNCSIVWMYGVAHVKPQLNGFKVGNLLGGACKPPDFKLE